MGLASSSLQRAASEIIRFPSTAKSDEKSNNEDHGADLLSDHQTTTPTTLLKAPVEGIGGVKGSCGTLDQCETDGTGSGSSEGSHESTPKMSERHGGLSRSLADRIESPEFTPFGGSTVREQPALVPVPVETVTPAVPFDADFMMRGTTRAAKNDESSEDSRASTFEAPFVRKACDICTRKKKGCDGNFPCGRCIKSYEKCSRSTLRKQDDAPSGVAPPAVTGRGNSHPPGTLNEEVLPPRCRCEGCPEPPLHGRRGGRPLWCQLHFVSQNSHQPLRCSVLQRTVSGDFLACWKETTWGWPGKAPARCERHKAEGQQRLELAEVVSLLRGVFAQVVWPELLERGWREEKVRCKSTYSLWMPPNVFRGTKDFKARVDYFDTAPQVIKYCLRTEQHHGWMMKVYQHLSKLPTPSSATGKLQPITDGKRTGYPNGSSRRGGAAFTQQAKHPQHERRDKPQRPSPATTRGFTHQLFSAASSPEQAGHDGNDGGSGSSRVADSFYPADTEAWPVGRSASVGSPQPPRPAQPHIPAFTSHRAARLRAQGLDPAVVTRIGLACSEEILAGCLARMGGGSGNVGGHLATLAASLRGFDGSVSGQENAAVSASSCSSKRPCSEISDYEMYYKELKRSRDLAHRSRDLTETARNDQSSMEFVEKKGHPTVTGAQ